MLLQKKTFSNVPTVFLEICYSNLGIIFGSYFYYHDRSWRAQIFIMLLRILNILKSFIIVIFVLFAIGYLIVSLWYLHHNASQLNFLAFENSMELAGSFDYRRSWRVFTVCSNTGIFVCTATCRLLQGRSRHRAVLDCQRRQSRCQRRHILQQVQHRQCIDSLAERGWFSRW